MSNRYHLPVVVTTDDDVSRQESIEYVESILANLEETEHVHRTYVEDSGLDEMEAQRLLEMIEQLQQSHIDAARDSMDELSDSDSDK